MTSLITPLCIEHYSLSFMGFLGTRGLGGLTGRRGMAVEGTPLGSENSAFVIAVLSVAIERGTRVSAPVEMGSMRSRESELHSG